MKKNKKLLKWSLSIIGITYIVILLFPQFLFANKLKYKNFTVYYHSENINAKNLKSILDESIALLEGSELFKKEINQKLFLCSSYSEFTFFALRSRKAFAVNLPLKQNIFLSIADISNNKINRNASAYNIRSLSAVIAHETTHSLLENKLGILKYKQLPSWKNEGYCDYIANESSYKTTNEKDEICNDNKKSNIPSYTYFKYRMFVEHLFDTEGITLNQFLKNDYDLSELERNYCAKN